MLPNHSPLTIAEQFGTLATLHPGRIDLGLGPGAGQRPEHDAGAAPRRRRRPTASREDVLELQGYLSGESRIPGVEAVPGRRAPNVPLYILGSSLFGAQLAAMLGLPYAFASHFAPAALNDAVALYRREFRPSAQLARAVRDRRRERDRRRLRRRGAGAVDDRAALARRPVRRHPAATSPTTRPTRSSPRRRASRSPR